MSTKNVSLADLLRTARARLSPEAFDLPRSVGRRARGLRQEEVAELAGISHVWYARLESGRGTLSLKALNRVADVLRLRGAERSSLLELARPELAQTTTTAITDIVSGLGANTTALREFARRSHTASASADIAGLATRAVAPLMGTLAMAYWQRFHVEKSSLEFVSTNGYHADALLGQWQSADAIEHVIDRVCKAEFVSECDLALSPSRVFRDRVTSVDIRAYGGLGIIDDAGLVAILGCAFRDAHQVTSFERFAIEAVAAISETALLAF